jgi:curved DNA-binding protein CbpA
MGNINSNEVDQLKQLYSMNNFQLEALRKELSDQKRINQQQDARYKQVISKLIDKQDGIRDKIPNNQFNKVNTFLTNINRDINSKNTGVATWKPGDSSNTPITSSARNRNDPMNGGARNRNDPMNGGAPSRNVPQKNYQETKKSQNEIDPYALYGITKGTKFTMDKLKETYKKYALQTHPDVEGGNQRNFAIINNAYKFLAEELKKMEKDKQYNQLKNEATGFIEAQEKSGKQNIELSGQNFNVNKFNSVFQDNQIEDTSNEGYNSWLKDNQYDTEDIVRDTSVTSGNFNSQFDSKVSAGREMQRYIVPQELNSRTGNVQELGVEQVENYSGESGKIRFTDLKEAHTTSRLVDPNTQYTQHKDVNALKSARSNMGDMPREQQDMLEQLELNRKSEQDKRDENQRRMDRMFSVHHEKMNNIFLGGR